MYVCGHSLRRDMAQGMIGNVGEFSAEQSGDFQDYMERFEQFCLANDIGEADAAAKTKKKAIFLSSVGSQTYRLVKTLLAPDKPADKTLNDITCSSGDWGEI